MPIKYKIDRPASVVFSKAYGILTDADVIDYQNNLSSESDFAPDLSQLVDFTDITEYRVSSETIQGLAQKNPFGKGSRRALVAPTPQTFGCARMFEMLTEESGHELKVVKDISSAIAFLKLNKGQLPW